MKEMEDQTSWSLNRPHRVGLLLYDPGIRQLFILKRKKPYGLSGKNVSIVDRPIWRTNEKSSSSSSGGFVEQYFIPRGIVNKNETFQTAAVREFFEETRQIPTMLILTGQQFVLYWNDPIEKQWTYTILFGLASFAECHHLLNVPKKFRNDFFLQNYLKNRVFFSIPSEKVLLDKYSSVQCKINQQSNLEQVYRCKPVVLGDDVKKRSKEMMAEEEEQDFSINCAHERNDFYFTVELVNIFTFRKIFTNQIQFYPGRNNYEDFIEWVECNVESSKHRRIC